MANMVLLGHGIIPHHHHHENVCLKNSHCQDDDKTHDEKEHSHDHDGNNDTSSCFLKQIDYYQPNSIRLNFVVKEYNSDFNSITVFLTGLLKSTEDLAFPSFSSIIRGNAFKASDYTSQILQSKGLRAPPVS